MNRALPRQLRMLVVNDEIDVDLFAGGGGWSEGFQRATGVPPMVAVNHDADAIRMHAANHPEADHHQEDVFAVDPVTACRGRPVRWLHGSPDCTHFSRAKGGKPKDKNIRGLAWVMVRWAEAVQPRIISLENVAEFTTWGPLGDDGQPIKARAGETFREFHAALEALGYVVEFRVLNAADFGAPTSRKRLFMLARRDGLPVVWPEPTHGPGRAKPWRTAAECIDWSIPCPSIFTRTKPLAEATQRRIAEGIRRYVLESKRPFLLTLTHGGRLQPLTEPMRTVTAAHRGEHALVMPFVSAIDNTGSGSASVWHPETPLTTITQEARHTVVTPVLVQAGYGERKGQAPRALDIGAPLGTVVAGGAKHALAAAFFTRSIEAGEEHERSTGANGVRPEGFHFCGCGREGVAPGHQESKAGDQTRRSGEGGAEERLERVSVRPRVAGWTPVHGDSAQACMGDDERSDTSRTGRKSSRWRQDKQPSIQPRSGQQGRESPARVRMRRSPKDGHAKGAVVESESHAGQRDDICSDCKRPRRGSDDRVSRGNMVSAFLLKFYSEGGQWCAPGEPLHTVVGKDRFGLVQVTLDGTPYVITDIGMRMLAPRELARAQGFPDSYVLTGTKTSQVARLGNSVVPHVAEALVRANLPQVRARRAA